VHRIFAEDVTLCVWRPANEFMTFRFPAKVLREKSARSLPVRLKSAADSPFAGSLPATVTGLPFRVTIAINPLHGNIENDSCATGRVECGRKGTAIRFHVFLRFGFGATNENCLPQPGIVSMKIVSTQDACLPHSLKHIARRSRQAERTLMEIGRRKQRANPAYAAQQFVEHSRIGVRMRGHALQSARTEHRHMDRGCRNRKTLVGADVGSRLRTPNMLFPRLQGKRETPSSIRNDSRPCYSSRHLSDKRIISFQ
jgi:hypothetical protein